MKLYYNLALMFYSELFRIGGSVCRKANTTVQYRSFRIKYLSTKGIVKTVMGEMRNVPNEQKKQFGQVLNDFKQFVENKYHELKEKISSKQQATEVDFDWTLPGDPFPVAWKNTGEGMGGNQASEYGGRGTAGRPLYSSSARQHDAGRHIGQQWRGARGGH